MRSLFLLFVVITFFSLLQVVKPKEQLEILTIEKSQTLDFSGSVFLPRTIKVSEDQVKPKSLELSIAGYKYKYVEKFNDFYLEKGEAEEVPVSSGDEIQITGTKSVKLFFVRRG